MSHTTKGTGVVISMSQPPFAMHFIEPWSGRGKPPTAFTARGFMSPALNLQPAKKPLPYIRRTRRA